MNSLAQNVLPSNTDDVKTTFNNITKQYDDAMVELRGHPCAKDCMRPTGKDRKIMKRDLGGLYAVGVLMLNKVGRSPVKLNCPQSGPLFLRKCKVKLIWL